MSENLDKLKKKIAEFDIKTEERDRIIKDCRHLVKELEDKILSLDMREFERLRCSQIIHSFHINLVSKIYEHIDLVSKIYE